MIDEVFISQAGSVEFDRHMAHGFGSGHTRLMPVRGPRGIVRHVAGCGMSRGAASTVASGPNLTPGRARPRRLLAKRPVLDHILRS